MTTPRSLLGLPNELFAMIIESDDLTVTDLASLRLTCKHTKHFASSALGRRNFVDLDIFLDENGFNWLFSLYLSDLGTCIRSVCLTWSSPTRFDGKCSPLKYYGDLDNEIKPDFARLQDIRIEHCFAPSHSWKKVLCTATHLRTFTLVDEDGPWFTPSFSTSEVDQIDTLLSSIDSDCLSSLVLADLKISSKILERMLDSHKETLSTLDIKRRVLIDENWLGVLDFARLNLSQLRSFRIDVCHEATKKVPGPKQGSRRRRNQYDLEKYSSPIELKLEGQKEIANGLSELLKACEGDQAQ